MRLEKERFRVLERARRTIRRFQMLEAGGLVVLAVSGGADSLVLLDVLAHLAPGEGVSLRVLHVDHGLRPDSGREADFVGEIARWYRLPFRSVRVEVPPPSASGPSPEEAARKARYRAFEAELEETGASRLATGHTADDRVETMLLRLLSGSGPRGMSGIPPKRGPYVRPLIGVWREEVEAYASRLPFVPLRDPTNEDLSVPRNWIRHRLLPFLEERYPGLRKVLLREAETLAEVWEFLETSSASAEGEGVRETERGLEVEKGFLLSLPLAVRRETVARALRRLGLEPDYHLLEDILHGLAEGEGCASLRLGEGLEARREYGRLIFGPGPGGGPVEVEAREEISLPGEGTYPLPGGKEKLRLEIITVRDKELPLRETGPRTAWLDADRLTFPLLVRKHRPGDRFHPLGAPGRRKLQDFLVDLKVPRRERAGVMVLESAGQIAWVVGLRIDERFKITGETRRAAFLRLL